ncbi:hypothetical protein [Planomonospora venezuelensis]|uniref:Uncharacterized protein n=1 Tax=Planomonospora venezuelensis TaxID=1999 RepID=A0A841DAD9_PLAVE|nr:hypothetical protein [Planomonospora venezuelensis]MBB5965095.1 hypothetical protein [Planomonospora venezuelensis]GIN03450.1 hypothetical protein Pve01_51080 [Planomonospora venezuelensis]
MSERKNVRQLSWAEFRRLSRAEILQMDFLPGWYATRTRRRVLAAAGLVPAALMWISALLAALITDRDVERWVYLGLGALVLVISIPVTGVLNTATRGATDLAERHLDEWQLAHRLRVTALAHRVTFGILGAAMAATLAVSAGKDEEFLIPGDVFLTMVIALFLTHMIMPLVISAWRLPDPPPDDED